MKQSLEKLYNVQVYKGNSLENMIKELSRYNPLSSLVFEACVSVVQMLESIGEAINWKMYSYFHDLQLKFTIRWKKGS
jgi:hypothetical protein